MNSRSVAVLLVGACSCGAAQGPLKTKTTTSAGKIKIAAEGVKPGLLSITETTDWKSFSSVRNTNGLILNPSADGSWEIPMIKGGRRFFRLQYFEKPEFTDDLKDQSVVEGGTATLQVAVPNVGGAVGARPVSTEDKTLQQLQALAQDPAVVFLSTNAPWFRWFKKGVSAPLAINTNALVLSRVTKSQAGDYFVIASGPGGSSTSRVAKLTVTNAAPPVADIAPSSIIGKTIFARLATQGPTYFVTAPSGNGFVLFPESSLDGSKGTYTFTKIGPATCTIAYDDYWLGRVTGTVTFTTSTTGSVSLRSAFATDSGTFAILTTTAPNSDIAPNSLNGRIIRVAIIDGDGLVFSDSGGYAFQASSRGSAYTISPFAFVVPSSGTYTYRKTGTDTAAITISDSRSGPASATIRFYSAVVGEVSVSSTDRSGGYQFAVFWLE